MAAMKPLQKSDFETAMGHELTDDQYDTLRFGVSLGFPGMVRDGSSIRGFTTRASSRNCCAPCSRSASSATP